MTLPGYQAPVMKACRCGNERQERYDRRKEFRKGSGKNQCCTLRRIRKEGRNCPDPCRIWTHELSLSLPLSLTSLHRSTELHPCNYLPWRAALPASIHFIFTFCCQDVFYRVFYLLFYSLLIVQVAAPCILDRKSFHLESQNLSPLGQKKTRIFLFIVFSFLKVFQPKICLLYPFVTFWLNYKRPPFTISEKRESWGLYYKINA